MELTFLFITRYTVCLIPHSIIIITDVQEQSTEVQEQSTDVQGQSTAGCSQ